MFRAVSKHTGSALSLSRTARTQYVRLSVNRRTVLELALGASAALVVGVGPQHTAHAADAGPRLYAFVPTGLGALSFQKLLAQAMPGTQVVVFGRHRDFDNALAEGPDGVLTLEPILRAKQLRPVVVGNNTSGSTEKYALISVGQAVEPADVTSVGAVDILGRQGMKEFVANLLGTSAKIEPVTKVEDLLPLLQLGSVDAVLAPERLVHALQAKSKLDLHTTRAPGAVGLPALSVMTAAGTVLARDVKRLGPQVCEEMGVTRWD